MQENLAVRLGFDSPEFLVADMPDDLDRKAILEQLTAAVSAVLGSGKGENRVALTMRAIGLAGQELLKARKAREVLYLISGAPAQLRDRPVLAVLRIKALRANSGPFEMVAEVNRLILSPKIDVETARKYVGLLRRYNSEHALNGCTKFIPYFWENPSALGADFAAEIERTVAQNTLAADYVATKLMNMRGLTSGPEQREFLRRLRWGREFAVLTKFMRQCEHEMALAGNSERAGAIHDQARAILENLKAAIEPMSLDAIQRAHGDGRSIVIASAHSGATVSFGWDGILWPLPTSVISQGGGIATQAGDFHLKTGASTTARDFAKLVKLARKSPRIIRIFPDGPDGEQIETTLMGKPFTMGKGAAAIAYLSGAATCFAGGRWNGSIYTLEVKTGPDPRAHSTRESFENEFTEFYTGCLRDILLGPPEDIGNGAGFWRMHVN